MPPPQTAILPEPNSADSFQAWPTCHASNGPAHLLLPAWVWLKSATPANSLTLVGKLTDRKLLWRRGGSGTGSMGSAREGAAVAAASDARSIDLSLQQQRRDSRIKGALLERTPAAALRSKLRSTHQSHPGLAPGAAPTTLLCILILARQPGRPAGQRRAGDVRTAQRVGADSQVIAAQGTQGGSAQRRAVVIQPRKVGGQKRGLADGAGRRHG